MHHRDYANHTIVVPRADGVMPQMTTFLLLSDVTELDGPTKLVPREKTAHIPLGINRTEMGEFFDDEVAVTGPAGTLMIYKTDTFHRASDFKAPGRSRFAMLMDFKARGAPWQGKLAWPNLATTQAWKDAMTRMTPRQRDIFGWPPAGDPYWNAQTLADVAAAVSRAGPDALRRGGGGGDGRGGVSLPAPRCGEGDRRASARWWRRRERRLQGPVLHRSAAPAAQLDHDCGPARTEQATVQAAAADIDAAAGRVVSRFPIGPREASKDRAGTPAERGLRGTSRL